MKHVLLSMMTLTVMTNAAYAACDSDMETTLRCQSTPQKGDTKVLEGIADKIDLCTKGRKTYISIENSNGSTVEEVKVSPRTGATVILIKDLDGSLAIGSRPYPHGVRMAKLLLNLGGLNASTTFTCKVAK